MIGPRSLSRAAAAAAALLTSPELSAQAPAPPPPPTTQDPVELVNRTIEEQGVFRFDFGVPASPSLNLLGQPEDKVTVVNGLKPFIIQLPRVLAPNSGDGQSLGIDFAPIWLLNDPSQQTFRDYVGGSLFHRALYRTHIGGAFYEGVANSDPAKVRSSHVTVGLSTSLLDDNDPLLARFPGQNETAWQTCLAAQSPAIERDWLLVQSAPSPEAVRIEDEMRPLIARRIELQGKVARGEATDAEKADLANIISQLTTMDANRAALTDAARTAGQAQFARTKSATVFNTCAEQANLAARYGASLSVGFGALWNGDPGRLHNFSQSGWVAWASFRHALGTPQFRTENGVLKISGYWMIGFSGRASVDEIVATNDATRPQVRANVFDGWGGIEYLSSASRLSLQVGYQIRDTHGSLPSFDRERLRYFASFSQRLGGQNSGMWVRVGYGHVSSRDDDKAAFSVSLLFAPPSAANIFGTN